MSTFLDQTWKSSGSTTFGWILNSSRKIDLPCITQPFKSVYMYAPPHSTLNLESLIHFWYHCSFFTESEDVCIVERLFSSSLVAIVSISSPRKLKVCHFKKGTEICNYSYSNSILAVKLNRQVSFGNILQGLI